MANETPAAARLRQVLDQAILGKPELVRMVVASFLAGGHVLLEGLPGLGKTVLAKTMAAATGLGYKRIQFTPDLMPADITGTHVLDGDAQGRTLRFVPGPVFTHFLLADEINRASPKTQAALLEAMSERSVTLAGETRALERPFFLIATQNPIEMEGTNPLPEAQLDRFAIKLEVPATDEATLLRIIDERSDGNPPPTQRVLTQAEVLAAQQAVDEVFLPVPVKTLIARLVARTTPGTQGAPDADPTLRAQVRYGASPRGAIWLAKVARALAYLDGRSGVGFEDVAAAAPHVLGHRVIPTYAARLDGLDARKLVAELYARCEAELLAHGGAAELRK